MEVRDKPNDEVMGEVRSRLFQARYSTPTITMVTIVTIVTIDTTIVTVEVRSRVFQVLYSAQRTCHTAHGTRHTARCITRCICRLLLVLLASVYGNINRLIVAFVTSYMPQLCVVDSV